MNRFILGCGAKRIELSDIEHVAKPLCLFADPALAERRQGSWPTPSPQARLPHPFHPEIAGGFGDLLGHVQIRCAHLNPFRAAAAAPNSRNKKTDVREHLAVVAHVGVLLNGPPGSAGLPFNQSANDFGSNSDRHLPQKNHAKIPFPLK